MAIHWYGERGIVNTLVTQLDKEGLDAGKALLNCIRWGATSNISWINQVTQIDYVVEIGLNSFGDPDLIVISKDANGLIHVVFIEAKAKTYAASLELDGYSRINRQLTFKYRFAVAQSRWRGDEHEAIYENQDEAAAYYPSSEEATVTDRELTQRKIAKRSVLAILKRVGLVGIPIDRIYFVAWTWDDKPFFETKDFLQSELRPMFMDIRRNEVLENSLTHLGWLGYQAIFECQGLQFLNAELRTSFATMQETNQPQIVNVAPPTTDVPLLAYRKFKPNEKYQPIGQQYTRIRDEIGTRFPHKSLSEYETGLSLTLQVPGGSNKVVLKLVPTGECEAAKLVMGVTTVLGESNWGGLNREIRNIGGRRPQPFYIVDIPYGNEGEVLALKVLDELDAFVRRDD